MAVPYSVVKAWRLKNPEKVKASIRRRVAKERIAREAKYALIAGTYRPAICQLCGRGGKICFDHNHKTGAFRGWICSPCNSALGLVHEDVALLLKMADYICQDGIEPSCAILAPLDSQGKGVRS